MIPQEKIESILSAARIEEVVGEFVSLRKRGANFLALCPFHDEKTPSFYVSPAKELYKCFGCGKAGNSVRFLMEHEKYTYPEALKYLAKKYNILVEEEQVTEDNQKEKDEIASIYIVLAFAEDFYHNYLLNTEEGKELGLTYLQSRKIEHPTIEKFKVGLSPSEKDLLSREALLKGYREEFLISSGLSIKTNDGKLIDRFRERIMFPIHSASGRTLGFGGRIMKSTTTEAKYINSPETKIYSKSKVLFGLNHAKNSIQKNDKCYLVEGYTDVLALNQSGIENVVASLGTSLTEEHTKIVKRYTNNLTFIFDGDEAGIKASLRGIDLALKEELNTRIVALPTGEDPDSFSKNNSINDLKLFLKTNATDFILFKTRFLFGESKDPLQKAEIVRNIIKSIIQIPNHINRSNYIKQLSTELDIEEDILYRELNIQLTSGNANFKVQRSSKSQEHQSSQLQEKFLKTISSEQEKMIVFILLSEGTKDYNESMKFADYISSFVSDSKWENSLFQKIYDYYYDYRQEKKEYPDIKHFIQHPNPEFQELASSFTVFENPLSENWEKKTGRAVITSFDYKKAIESAKSYFELRKYQQMEKEIVKKQKQADIQSSEMQSYIIVHKELKRTMQEIASKNGIIIY